MRWRLLSLLILVLVSGCAARRNGDVLRATRFEGNTPPKGTDGVFAPQTDRALRNAISQPSPSRLGLLFPGLIEPAYLDASSLIRDGLRLEVWYANHGYFDARFEGWEIQRPHALTPFHRKIQPIILVGHVHQGTPSRVRTVAVTGLEGLNGPIRRRVEELVTVVPGDIFDRDVWRASVDDVQNRLRDSGYAHARVTTAVEVDPAKYEVDVSIDVFVGPFCRLGEVTLAGLERLPADRVRLEVDLVPGQAWSLRALSEARSTLFSLGTFSVVNLVPDEAALKDDTATVIPVTITLREGNFRTVQAGPSLQVESHDQRVTMDVSYRDVNFVGRGWQLESALTAGAAANIDFAALADFALATGVAPVANLRTTLTIPHTFLPDIAFGQTGTVLLDYRSGLRYFEPSWSPQLVWKDMGMRHLALSLEYRISYFTALGETSADTTYCDPATNRPITDDALLSMLGQSLSYSSKNDLMEPNRGWVWSIDTTEAGGPLGGSNSFLRARASVTRYVSIPRLLGFDPDLWVLAGRVGGGIIHPYGPASEAVVPWTERLFLGGGSSVRGWGARELGPVGSQADCGSIAGYISRPGTADNQPLGGDLSLYGNLEMRLGWFHDVGVAAFVDAGQVWATPADFELGGELGIQASVGGGLRYNSSIGTIRIDLSRQLGAWNKDDQPFLTPNLALSEAF